MIQRVQTIYLLLASLAIYALFLFPILKTDDGQIIKITGVYQSTSTHLAQSQSFIPLTIATVILGLIPIILIFMYKNRIQQMRFVYVLVLIVIGYSFWLSQIVKSTVSSNLEIQDYSIGAGLTSLAILFLILATKAIGRDEKLVKSADRLR